MRVLILGVGDAFTRKHFGTSALIETPQGYVLIDCPDLVHRALYEATTRAGWNVEALDIDDVLLTHLHGDHCNGLESFAFCRRIRRADSAQPPPLPSPPRPPRLHTSRAAASRIWERLGPAMDAAAAGSPRTVDEFFDLRVLEPQQTASVAGLSVRCRSTGHPIPTIGLMISDETGFTVGWSSDTPFDAGHIEWLSAADVIVHESNLGPAHTPIERLNELPPEIRRKIRLVHLPDDFDASCTDMRILAEGEVLE